MSETKALTLYDIEDDLRALVDTEEGMEADDDQRLAILDEIAQKTEQAITKRDHVIRFLRHLDIQMEAVDTEVARLQALKKNWKAAKVRLENYVARVIEESVAKPKRGNKKLEGSLGVLTLRKSPDHVEIADADLIPNKYQDVTITISGEDDGALLDLLLDLGADGLIHRIEDASKWKARKADIKKAIDRGEDVPGADVVYGADRLVVR